MSHSPKTEVDSKRYADGWRAINVLIRSGGSWSGRERNVFLHNLGDGKFRDESFVTGLDFNGDGRSFAPLDIDRDGDQDLILKFRTGPQLRILENRAATGHSLSVALRGAKSNREGVGALVTLETDRRRLLRHVRSGSGFYSQPSRRVHFGLADGEEPQVLVVAWPGGERERFTSFPGAGVVIVEEGGGTISPLEVALPVKISQARREADVALQAGTRLREPLPAPDFELDGIGMGTKLADYRGRKVLLNFWATWCPPCREELRDFVENYATFQEGNIEILAVSVDDPAEREQVRSYAAEQGLKFPVLFANDQVVAAYTILNRHLTGHQQDLAIPTSFLIDEQGRILKIYRGAAGAELVVADASQGNEGAIPFAGHWFGGPPARDYLTIATEMAARGLQGEARALFEPALAEGEAGYEIHNNLAGLLIESGEFERAAELLRKSLAINSKQVDARINLAGVLIEQGDPRGALTLLEEARGTRADDPLIYGRLGSAYFMMNDSNRSESSYREAIRLDPEAVDSHSNLGSLLASMGRFPEAIASFEEARRLGGHSARLLGNLGVLYMETGQRAKGSEAFLAAVEADPADYGARMNLAMFYLDSDEIPASFESIEVAKELAPERPEAFLMEAQIVASQGALDKAREMLTRIVQEHPGFEPALKVLEELTLP